MMLGRDRSRRGDDWRSESEPKVGRWATVALVLYVLALIVASGTGEGPVADTVGRIEIRR
jgi:hypothetical protein